MHIATVSSHRENVHNAILKFQEQLPASSENMSDDQLNKFNTKIDKILKGKEPDCHEFIDYLTKDNTVSPFLNALKPKATKRRPLAFERLNMILMSIFKYFENEITEKGNKMSKEVPKIQGSL